MSMLDRFGSWFLAFGPLGVIGAGTVVIMWFILRGYGRNRNHWRALFYGPGLTGALAYGATFLVVKLIDPSEGSGFLLGGTVLGLYIVGLIFYYPILIVVFLALKIKHCQDKNDDE